MLNRFFQPAVEERGVRLPALAIIAVACLCGCAVRRDEVILAPRLPV